MNEMEWAQLTPEQQRQVEEAEWAAVRERYQERRRHEAQQREPQRQVQRTSGPTAAGPVSQLAQRFGQQAPPTLNAPKPMLPPARGLAQQGRPASAKLDAPQAAERLTQQPWSTSAPWSVPHQVDQPMTPIEWLMRTTSTRKWWPWWLGGILVAVVIIGIITAPAPPSGAPAAAQAAIATSAAAAGPTADSSASSSSPTPADPPPAAADQVAPAPAAAAPVIAAPVQASAPVAAPPPAPARAPAPAPAASCDEATHYVNSSGSCIPRPEVSTGGAPAGATARCEDGDYSFSRHRSGTCSGHGGVAQWLTG